VRPTFSLSILTLFAAALPSAAAAPLGDWPQYAGPNHDRTAEAGVDIAPWGREEGPRVVWRVPLSGGFSSMTVADGRVYTLVTREARETCVALDFKTGKELWSSPLAAEAKYDGGGDAGTDDNRGGDGPRCTPTVADGRVFVLDSRLGLACLDAKTGKTRWSKDLVAEYDGKNISWQSAAAPMVVGDRVLVAGGGAGRTFLAFSAKKGELLWSTGDEKITHATPTLATICGVPQVIFFAQSGLVALDPKEGKELWRAEYPYKVSTAASPVVDGDSVYLSAGYGVGAGVYALTKDDEGFHPELLWQKRNKLQNHWSTPVLLDGHLYGMFSFKEYGEGPIKCVELSTGEEKWSEDGFGPGNCILVGGHLLALSDCGEVVWIEPDPEEYDEVVRHDVLDGKCWSTPSYSDGQLFVRSTTEGVRLDLTAGAKGKRSKGRP